MDQYAIGQTIKKTVTFRRNGDVSLVDPTSPVVKIRNEADEIIEDGIVPDRISLGQYLWQWTVPADTLEGTYTYIVYGTIDGQSSESNAREFAIVSAGGIVDPSPLVIGYCSVADVRAKLPAMAANKSPMSDEDIQDIITEVSSEIDAALSKRYALPIDDPPEILRLICKRLVCAEVLDVRQSGDTKAQEVPLSVRINGHANGALENLRSGKTVLPGIPFIANVGASTSLPHHHGHLRDFDGRHDNDPRDHFAPNFRDGAIRSWPA